MPKPTPGGAIRFDIHRAFQQSLAEAHAEMAQDRSHAADQRQANAHEDAMRNARAKMVQDATNSLENSRRR